MGSLTNDGKPDIKEAKKWLEKALKDGPPKDTLYQTVQRDLWLLKRTLEEENKDASARLFLQMFDALEQMQQEKKCKTHGKQENMPLSLEERDAIYAQIL